MGAAYIVTGTVNQACIESGSSDIVRKMLAEAEQADVTMAPAVDMFEMGVKLQVLKRGTMFAMRGNKLYELYRSFDSIDSIPDKERESLENTIFKAPLEDIWQLTQNFFNERDPEQIVKAEQDPKHKMALIFRWYLGLSSRWANAGEASRQVDYQVWCGPAMGAFNEWTKGSWLAEAAARNIKTVALNILYGAAVAARINNLHSQGVKLSHQAARIEPLKAQKIETMII
jgi:PfaD family protein